MTARRILMRLFVVPIVLLAVAGLGCLGYLYWPREPGASLYPQWPKPVLRGGRLLLEVPAQVVAAEVASFEDEVDAHLHFEYLRSVRGVDDSQVILTATEKAGGPSYRMYVLVANDLLTAVPYLNELRRRGLIADYELNFWTRTELVDAGQQSRVFLAAYNAPPRQKLEALSPTQLIVPLAKFVQFKSKMDNRVRENTDPAVQPLSPEDAHQLAADIIAVAHFYALPLDAFLGIGAMENNYMDVPGDLDHTVWKRRAERGDIVVRRGRRRFLVRNYSLGRWQITRETLRYAHKLYLKDIRDYSALPERLRPSPALDLDRVSSGVLTTYAGVLFRDLLDHFNGDVEKALGAYNGGVKRPNLEYAAGVTRAADHARKVLEHAPITENRPAEELAPLRTDTQDEPTQQERP